MPADFTAKPEEAERELDRLSQELKDQVRLATDRLADRYVKLMEHRSFDSDETREA